MTTMEQIVEAAREALFTIDVENTSSGVLAETAIRAALPILGDAMIAAAEREGNGHSRSDYDDGWNGGATAVAEALRARLSEIMEGK